MKEWGTYTIQSNQISINVGVGTGMSYPLVVTNAGILLLSIIYYLIDGIADKMTGYTLNVYFSYSPAVVTGMSQTTNTGVNIVTLYGYNFGATTAEITEIYIGKQPCTR